MYVFSKLLHLIPVKTKCGPSLSSAFISLFHEDDSRRRIWGRIDKGKEFQKKHFHDMIREEVIRFQACTNPDVKCAVAERIYRTISNRMYRYFTFRNTYRYINVLPIFIKAYNETVHSTTGMTTSQVTDADVIAIRRRMEAKRQRVRVETTKFRVGQHVRISKSKCSLQSLQNTISIPKYLASFK